MLEIAYSSSPITARNCLSCAGTKYIAWYVFEKALVLPCRLMEAPPWTLERAMLPKRSKPLSMSTLRTALWNNN
jgi:hypothetical protein